MSYWDTSALFMVFASQRRSTEMRVLAGEDTEPATSWLTTVETWAGLARLVREEVLTPAEAQTARAKLDEFRATATEVGVSGRLRDLVEIVLQAHPLRAGDAIHLAAALLWAKEDPEGLNFICLDDCLREAASREGFTVLPAS